MILLEWNTIFKILRFLRKINENYTTIWNYINIKHWMNLKNR